MSRILKRLDKFLGECKRISSEASCNYLQLKRRRACSSFAIPPLPTLIQRPPERRSLGLFCFKHRRNGPKASSRNLHNQALSWNNTLWFCRLPQKIGIKLAVSEWGAGCQLVATTRVSNSNNFACSTSTKSQLLLLFEMMHFPLIISQINGNLIY